MTTCFDCKFRKIWEINRGDIECHCKKDGRWRNPYRPMVLWDIECPNWVRKEEDDEETVRN